MSGVISYLHEGDVNAFYHNMFLSAAIRQRFLKCVQSGMKCDPGYLLSSCDRSIYEALSSGDPGMLKELAQTKTTINKDMNLDNPYYYFFAVALRLLIMDVNDKAESGFQYFNEARQDNLEGYSLIVDGVLHGDNGRFNEGLNLALDERRREFENDENVYVGEQWLSVECLGLARLGESKGLKVGISDSLLPAELLGSPSEPYPDPDEIFPPIPENFIEVSEEI